MPSHQKSCQIRRPITGKLLWKQNSLFVSAQIAHRPPPHVRSSTIQRYSPQLVKAPPPRYFNPQPTTNYSRFCSAAELGQGRKRPLHLALPDSQFAGRVEGGGRRNGKIERGPLAKERQKVPPVRSGKPSCGKKLMEPLGHMPGLKRDNPLRESSLC